MVWVMNDIMFMFSICSIHGCEELVWLQPGVHSSCASQFLCVRDMSTRFRFARTALHLLMRPRPKRCVHKKIARTAAK